MQEFRVGTANLLPSSSFLCSGWTPEDFAAYYLFKSVQVFHLFYFLGGYLLVVNLLFYALEDIINILFYSLEDFFLFLSFLEYYLREKKSSLVCIEFLTYSKPQRICAVASHTNIFLLSPRYLFLPKDSG